MYSVETSQSILDLRLKPSIAQLRLLVLPDRQPKGVARSRHRRVEASNMGDLRVTGSAVNLGTGTSALSETEGFKILTSPRESCAGWYGFLGGVN